VILVFLVDTHCDTLFARSTPNNPFADHTGLHVTPQRLRQGGVTLQVCALYAGPDGPKGRGANNPRAMAEAQLNALPQLTSQGIQLVDNPFDANEGQCHVMLSIEGGEIIEDSIERLRDFRALGVRLLSLTWNHENLIAYPHTDHGHRGLKPFGWQVVKEMNKLGIAADVSHLGEGGFWDLIFHNEKPPMASHSCCRKLCMHTRNLTDDQIRALIECKGWIGINFCPAFLTEKGRASVDTVIDHIAHIADLGGIENVGFGSDFDGIQSTPEGLAHPGDFPNLLSALAKRGFLQNEIAAIAGRNFLRYMKQFTGQAV